MADPVRAVVLDLGNVLAFHDDLLVLRRFAEVAGLSLEGVATALSPIWQDIGVGRLAGEELRRDLGTRLGVDLSLPDLLAIWNCHFRVHEAVLPVVERLLEHVPVFLLSNTNAWHIDYLREKLPILARFAGQILSHEVGCAKPNPEIYRLTVTRTGFVPGQLLFFDDVERNVVAARKIGMQAQIFSTAASFEADLVAAGIDMSVR